MTAILRGYDKAIKLLSAKWAEAAMLLVVRIALAGIFWRAGRTKVDDGSLLSVSENTLYQFADEPFNNIPVLSAEFAAYLATYAEHLFPFLLVFGLFTRVSALALLGMTLMIQFFVFPDAWWQVHILWVALALVLIVRGGGGLSLDMLLQSSRTGRRT